MEGVIGKTRKTAVLPRFQETEQGGGGIGTVVLTV